MKRSRAGRMVPALVMTAGTALPIVTTVEMLNHASSGGSALSSAPLSNVAAAATPVPSRVPARAALHPTSTPRPAPTAAPTPHTYVGTAVADHFGTVQATITVTGKRITNVSIAAPMDDPRSADINSQVVPMLQSETLQAQGANIDLISGATETSDAYIQSLQAALQSAGI